MGTYDTRGGAPLHDPAADHEGACDVCGYSVDDCACPECPTCGAHGDPKCYAEHGLVQYTVHLQECSPGDYFNGRVLRTGDERDRAVFANGGGWIRGKGYVRWAGDGHRETDHRWLFVEREQSWWF